MQFHGRLRTWAQQLIMLSLLLLATAAWAGSKYKVLYAFKGGNDGIDPQGNLVFDPAGNLYGTTTEGGGTTNCNGRNEGCGIVFQLVPQAHGPWKENVLYSVPSEGGGLNGALVLDAVGNLYGTAFYGGAYFTGTVFELTPGSGGWTEKDIYTFCPAGCDDGESPGSGVILDDDGNLYGTADQGGTYGGGVIFKLSPGGGGDWVEHVVFDFCPFKPCNSGGWLPWGLFKDASGDLYGMTTWGGNYFWPCIPGDGCGAVFKLSPKSGNWDYSVLHRFVGRDGAFPSSGVIQDKRGNVYGTTSNDGAFGCGTVFELSPKTGGGWTYKVLYNLRGGPSAGSPAMDAAGNLYLANSGVIGNSCQGPADGEIFKLSPRVHGHWKYSSVHKMNGGTGGGWASSGLILDREGNFYGTAAAFGTYGFGVVFELTP